MKMQAVNTADSHQTRFVLKDICLIDFNSKKSINRKAVRATLILIPLLGLHFILTPFRPETKSFVSNAYEVFSAIVSSLQVTKFRNFC